MLRNSWRTQQIGAAPPARYPAYIPSQRPINDSGNNLRQLEALGHDVILKTERSCTFHQLQGLTATQRGLEGYEQWQVYKKYARNILQPLTYNRYALHQPYSPLAFQTGDCHNTLRELHLLKKAGLTVHSQGVFESLFSWKAKPREPGRLLDISQNAAIHSNYRVYPPKNSAYPQSPPPLVTPRGRVDARYSVGIQPGMQGDLVRLLPELMQRYAGVLDHVKVTAPSAQGTRPDGMIFYFARPDENQAVSNDIARYLRFRLPHAQWRQPPEGMLQIRNEAGAIGGYGETFTSNEHRRSFGSARAELVSNAIASSLEKSGNDCVVAQTYFHDELRQELRNAGYDPDCPALISRRELFWRE